MTFPRIRGNVSSRRRTLLAACQDGLKARTQGTPSQNRTADPRKRFRDFGRGHLRSPRTCTPCKGGRDPSCTPDRRRSGAIDIRRRRFDPTPASSCTTRGRGSTRPSACVHRLTCTRSSPTRACLRTRCPPLATSWRGGRFAQPGSSTRPDTFRRVGPIRFCSFASLTRRDGPLGVSLPNAKDSCPQRVRLATLYRGRLSRHRRPRVRA